MKYLILSLLLIGCGRVQDSPFGTETFNKFRNQNQKAISEIHNDNNILQFSLIADTHQNHADLESIFKYLNDSEDDFVIHLGDATDIGSNYEYDLFFDIMTLLKKPWLMAIGNHDAIVKGREIYEKHMGHYNQFFDHKGVRFVLFNNNSLEFRDVGLDYDWLFNIINSSPYPVLLFQHVDLKNPDYFTEYEKNKNEELLYLNNLKVIFNGHKHVLDTQILNGKLLQQVGRVEGGSFVRVIIDNNLKVYSCGGGCYEVVNFNIF